jgi:hypothetical protein
MGVALRADAQEPVGLHVAADLARFGGVDQPGADGQEPVEEVCGQGVELGAVLLITR